MPVGDFFQKAVLELVKQIPEGRVSTYGALAEAVGRKKAARAVGRALNRNPEPVKVPCHRVVKSDGSVGGYKHGAAKKEALLKSEGVRLTGDGVADFKKVFFGGFRR